MSLFSNQRIWTLARHPLVWINLGLISSLGAWVVFGNAIATQQEQSLDRRWQTLVQKFPQKNSNKSAQTLEQLRAQLGLPELAGLPNTNRFPPKARDRQAYEAIQKPLTQYFEEQVKQPTDALAPLPHPLRQYLIQYAAPITAIQTHLLTQPFPQWDRVDLRQYQQNPNTPLPSRLNLLNLSRILLLDAIAKQQQGDRTTAFRRVLAAATLRRSLYEQPDLISHLVALISFNLQSDVVRQLEPLPPGWQQQLTDQNSEAALWVALESEAFISAGWIRSTLNPDQTFWQDIGISLDTSGFSHIRQWIQQPYFRLAAANYAQITLAQYRLTNESPGDRCDDRQAEPSEAFRFAVWWNIFAPYTTAFINQPRKLVKRDLYWELTQKVIQIKTTAAPKKAFPATIPNIQRSQVCPSLQWSYQAKPDGTARLKLQNPPAWLGTDLNPPLSYTFRKRR